LPAGRLWKMKLIKNGVYTKMNFLYTLILLAVLTPGKTPGAGVLSISSPISTKSHPIVGSGAHLAAASFPFPPTAHTQEARSGEHLAAAHLSSPDEDQFILNVLFLGSLALATLLILGFAFCKWVVVYVGGAREVSFEGHLSIDENVNGKDLAARVHLALSQVRGVRNVFINLSETSPCSELLARGPTPSHMEAIPAGLDEDDVDIEQALILDEIQELENDIHPATIKPGTKLHEALTKGLNGYE